MTSKWWERGWHQSVGVLIDQLDQPDFWRYLAQELNKYVPVDNWVSLIFCNSSPHILDFAERSNMRHEQDPLLRDYASGLYLLDPFYIANRDNKEGGVFLLSQVAPEEFLQTEYYNLYFTHYVSVDEVQFNVQLDVERALCLSLGSKQTFKNEQVALFELIKPWVMALMLKRMLFEQNLSSEPSGRSSLDEAMDRLGKPLTARELDVVRLVLSGFSNKEVANRLSLSPETVKVHRRNFYTKLNIKSQSELFALCFQRNNINTA